MARPLPTSSLNRNGHRSQDSLEHARADLTARLQARRPEVEQAVLTRIFAVADAGEVADPEYIAGLHDAVSAALDYGIAVVELGEERSPPVPAALLAQARMAARNGVSLDTVLRRYFAGYSLLSYFLIEEVEDGGLFQGASLKQLLRAQATLFDHLLAAVSEEYGREAGSRLDTAEQRLAERVQRLLDGELLDTSELLYDFDTHHLGLIAKGPDAPEAVRELVAPIDCRLLSIRRSDGSVWAWLGSRRGGLTPDQLGSLASSCLPPQVSLAIGEPAEGLSGWRLTHRQARAAILIAQRGPRNHVRYADVALLASMLQDDLLATSLRQLYLVPLEDERDRGEVWRETLRAYLGTDRNVSSAAAALGVSRRTVTNRLLAIEESLGCRLNSSTAEIEVALRHHEFEVGWSLSQSTT
jgi:hypothetical protein